MNNIRAKSGKAVALIISICTALTACGSASLRSAGCSAPPGFVCVGSGQVGDSYCLRPTSNARPVREVFEGTWPVGNGNIVQVRIDPTDQPTCKPQKVPFAEGDRVTIQSTSKGVYALNILEAAANYKPYFENDLALDVESGNLFYLTAHTDPSSKFPDLDIFVMLLDDKEGEPQVPDKSLIEKFYRLEFFPSKHGLFENKCEQDRPDRRDGNGLANYARNDSVKKVLACRPSAKSEIVTGGGGEHPKP